MNLEKKQWVFFFAALFCASSFAETPCGSAGDRAVIQSQRAQTQKMSEKIQEYQNMYNRINSIAGMCYQFMNNISIAGIAQAANIPTLVVDPVVHVLIEKLVVPEINNKAMQLCQQASGTVGKQISGFEKAVLPPDVMQTTDQVRGIMRDIENQTASQQQASTAGMIQAQSYNGQKAIAYASSTSQLSGAQTPILRQIQASSEYQSALSQVRRNFPMPSTPTVAPVSGGNSVSFAPRPQVSQNASVMTQGGSSQTPVQIGSKVTSSNEFSGQATAKAVGGYQAPSSYSSGQQGYVPPSSRK